PGDDPPRRGPGWTTQPSEPPRTATRRIIARTLRRTRYQRPVMGLEDGSFIPVSCGTWSLDHPFQGPASSPARPSAPTMVHSFHVSPSSRARLLAPTMV